MKYIALLAALFLPGAGLAEEPLAFVGRDITLRLSAEDIRDTAVIMDSRNRPAVSLTLSRDGASALFEFTAQNVGRQISVQVCGTEVTAPVIRDPIGGSQLMLSGAFSMEEAENLSDQLSVKVPCPG